MRRIWANGDAVLPLPDNSRDASAVINAMRPDEILRGGKLHPAETPGRVAAVTAPLLPTNTALAVGTSGTTGSPRGVVLSHRAVKSAVTASTERLGQTREDRWLCCLPLVHLAGLLVLLRGSDTDHPTIVHDRFDVERIRAALNDPHPPTMISLVPTMLHRLLDAGVDLSVFRVILLGGAGEPVPLLEHARRVGVNIVTSYGMTETCGGIVYDGLPLDDVGVAIEPDGRILVSGPTLLSGYRDGADVHLDGAWFATQDRGGWNGSGRLTVQGRLDDVVICGGENVSLNLVARTLEEHPPVREAVAVGIADPEWGTRVEAWLTADGGVNLSDIAGLARRQLAPAAVPKAIHLVDSLPRTSLEKPVVAELSGTTVRETWRADSN